ncbi:MAG: hypothetical protein ACOX52_07335 [Verrucomicrobiota bacterium]
MVRQDRGRPKTTLGHNARSPGPDGEVSRRERRGAEGEWCRGSGRLRTAIPRRIFDFDFDAETDPTDPTNRQPLPGGDDA